MTPPLLDARCLAASKPAVSNVKLEAECVNHDRQPAKSKPESARFAFNYHAPRHPYTELLFAATPALTASSNIATIPGAPPRLDRGLSGCPFHPRCPAFMPGLCDTVMPEETYIVGDAHHTVRCHLYPGSTPSGSVSIPSSNISVNGAG